MPDRQLGNHGKDWKVGRRLTESAVKFLDERDAAARSSCSSATTSRTRRSSSIPITSRSSATRPRSSRRHRDVRTERDGQTRIVQNDAAYGSEVAGLDTFVGTVLAKLETSGLAGQTRS